MGNSVLKFLLVQLGAVLATILFILFLPLSSITVLCFYVFRCLLKFYVKHFKPEFGNIVSIRSTIFATDYPDRNTLTALVVPLIFEGSIDIDQLRTSISNKINQKRGDGNYLYPELQQSLSSFFGYRFWKWDKNFDISNHVHLGFDNIRELNEGSLNQMTAKFLRKSFGHRSPWEVYLFAKYYNTNDPDDNKVKCAILTRHSHCLADGFAVMEVISEAAGRPIEGLQLSHKLGILGHIKFVLLRLIIMLLSPYQIAAKFIATVDQNLFDAEDNKDEQPLVVRFNDPIPVKLVKDLKNKLKTSFEGLS